jgi:hypothetical protein
LAQSQPLGQSLPQPPQLLGSDERSTHIPIPLQKVVPEAQMQLPFEQTAPSAQTVWQPPQFAGSLLVSMHRSPQIRCPAGQAVGVGATSAGAFSRAFVGQMSGLTRQVASDDMI